MKQGNAPVFVLSEKLFENKVAEIWIHIERAEGKSFLQVRHELKPVELMLTN